MVEKKKKRGRKRQDRKERRKRREREREKREREKRESKKHEGTRSLAGGGLVNSLLAPGLARRDRRETESSSS